MWRLHEVTRDAWACFPQGPCLGMQRNAGLEDQHGGQLQSLNASDLRAAVSVPRQDAHIAVSGLGDELCQPEWQAKNFTKGVGSRHCSVAIFLLPRSPCIQCLPRDELSLFGVFDGHGGAEVDTSDHLTEV